MTSYDTTTTFSFPYPECTKIEGKPTFLTVTLLKKELLANAISVTSSRGNGTLGHAVFVLGQAEYDNQAGAGNNWVDPVNPGNEPVVPAGSTGPQIANINSQWKRELTEFKIYDAVHKKLKQQLLSAVDKSYLSSLDDDMFGFTNVTLVQLITHLVDNYAEIDADALTKNMEDLKLPWEPNDTMEPLWQRGNKAQRVANAGNDPITDASLLRIYRDLLHSSGLFPLDIRDWDRLPVAQRTLDNFKTTFNRANKTRIKTMTSSQLGQANFLGATTTPTGSAFSAVTATTAPPTNNGPYCVLCRDKNNNWTPMYYCWTHGLGNNEKRTSLSCTRKAEGHKEDATVVNMLGGNNSVRTSSR